MNIFFASYLDSATLKSPSLRRGCIGIFGFAVLAIFRSVFRFLCQKLGFSVLVFIAVCAYSVFQHLVFGFREKYWWVFKFDIRYGFRFLLFDLCGFRSLFNLSGNYAPSFIPNSC